MRVEYVYLSITTLLAFTFAQVSSASQPYGRKLRSMREE